MDRLWDRFFGEEPLARGFVGEWSPTVDVSETKNELLVKAELRNALLTPKSIVSKCSFFPEEVCQYESQFFPEISIRVETLCQLEIVVYHLFYLGFVPRYLNNRIYANCQSNSGSHFPGLRMKRLLNKQPSRALSLLSAEKPSGAG